MINLINRELADRFRIKCVKNHRNWFSYFEDVSRRYEPSDVVS